MWNKLKSLFKADNSIKSMLYVGNMIDTLLLHIEGSVKEGEGMRNAAIDAIIEILQEEKTK